MTSDRHSMTMLTPAANWRDAIPCGNGPMAAMVYGGISPETILFNHDSLWCGGKITQVPDTSSFLPQIRKMVLSGDFQGANTFYAEKLKERGFAGQMPSLHPAFDFRIRMPQSKAFKNYRRHLDFSTGQVTVTWEDDNIHYQRDFFVSRDRKELAVMRIKSNQSDLSAGFALCEHNLMDLVDMAGKVQDIPFTYESQVIDNMLVLVGKGSDGGDFGAVLKLHCPQGNLTSHLDISWTDQTSALPMLWEQPIQKLHHLQVTGATEIVAVVAMFVNAPAAVAVPKLVAKLHSLPINYDELLVEHCHKHTPLFMRCALELDFEKSNSYFMQNTNEALLLQAYQGSSSAPLISKLYDMGRYLLISCSDEDSNPPTLQAHWNGDYYPAWNSFYVHNENTQMFYWQALQGSMPEVTWAMTNYFERFLKDYQENARKLFGCRGIFIPLTAAANTGLLQDPQPHVIYFTGVAPWVAQHFYDYWLFTRDKSFLEHHAYPFIKECAMFYTDFIELDQEGFCRFIPSNSPENAPKNSVSDEYDDGHHMNPGLPLSINSTIDVCLAREIFTNCISACEELGFSEPELPVWRDLLQKLRPLRINEDGALAEWIYPEHQDNYAHRHLSHIYPLFPGFQITNHENQLFEAVKVALDKRLSIGLEAQTGWSLAHLANIFSRMQMPDRARECLNILCQTCLGANLLTYHNDYRHMGVTLDIIMNLHAPYQADAIMGVTGAIQEMMIFSRPGLLRILPALQSDWRKGKIGQLTTRNGAQVHLSWDQDRGEIEATITATVATQFTIEWPSEYTCNKASIVELKDKQTVLLVAHKN